MTVFKREFRRNFKGLLIWSLSIAGMALLMLSSFQSSADAAGTSSYPAAFIKAMGMDKVDMSTLLGYYAGKASVLVTLFGGIYAALLGSGAIVRDESLLSRPITRASIALQRLCCAAVNLLLLNLLTAAALFTCGAEASALWVVLAQFLLHLVFAAMGFAIAVLKIKSRAAVALPLGIVLGSYVLSMLYGMSEQLGFVKYLTPFYYTDIREVVASGGMPALNIAVVSAIIVALAALGTSIYRRKDLPI